MNTITGTSYVWSNMISFWTFLPPASAVEVIESELWVCVCVCQHSHAKPFDLWPWFLVWRLTLTLVRLGLLVKVVGQRSWSPGQKIWFSGFCLKGIQSTLVSLYSNQIPPPISYTVMRCVCQSIRAKRTFWEKVCTWGERWRYVNAQVFSCLIILLILHQSKTCMTLFFQVKFKRQGWNWKR